MLVKKERHDLKVPSSTAFGFLVHLPLHYNFNKHSISSNLAAGNCKAKLQDILIMFNTELLEDNEMKDEEKDEEEEEGV